MRKSIPKAMALILVLTMLLSTTGLAAIRINQWIPTAPYNTQNGGIYTNLATSATVTLESAASGNWSPQHPVTAVNDGQAGPGWAYRIGITNDTPTVVMTFPSVQTVNSVFMYGMVDGLSANNGYGLPRRFQIYAVLSDDTEQLVYNQSEADLVQVALGQPVPVRCNFSSVQAKAIKIKMLQPNNYNDTGNAFPDSNLASYWISEIQIFNDSTFNVGTSSNLALKGMVVANKLWGADRQFIDLVNGDKNSVGGGEYLLATNQVSAASPLNIDMFYNNATTMNEIKIFGAGPGGSNNGGGVPSAFKIYGCSTAYDTGTLLYNSSTGTSGVTVSQATPYSGSTPLTISFNTRKCYQRYRISATSFTNCGDANVQAWLEEIEMYNNGGATSIQLNSNSVTLDLSNTTTSQLSATLQPSSSQTVNWSSSNTAVATVNFTGLVSAVATGMCYIIITAADDSTLKKTIPVVVTKKTGNLMTINPTEDTNMVLHNSDMGWVAYDNYVFNEVESPISTSCQQYGYTYPGVDNIMLKFTWSDIETSLGVFDWIRVDYAYNYWRSKGKNVQIGMSTDSLLWYQGSNGYGAAQGVPTYLIQDMQTRNPNLVQVRNTATSQNKNYITVDASDYYYQQRLSLFDRNEQSY
jgi:hypothetical protein